MTIWKYKHDRGGDTAPLSVTITVDGRHGVIGLNGIAPASGFTDGIINTAGDLKAADGSDYVTGAARPGVDPDPDFYRLTVRKGGKPVSSITFQPILPSAAATDLDINTLVRSGKAIAATPQQLIDLATGVALVPQMQQALDANTAASALATQQAAQARAIALQLQAIYDLSSLQASYDLFSAAQLNTEGWTIRATDAGGSRIIQTLGDAGPLELQANPDGSITFWGEPSMFEATLNPDNTVTLWRVI